MPQKKITIVGKANEACAAAALTPYGRYVTPSINGCSLDSVGCIAGFIIGLHDHDILSKRTTRGP
jgi:hypothetical protein